MKKGLTIVCLGGGIGTVNLIKGLSRYSQNISVIVSMADEGGSAGRLRRLYGVHPPGDLVSCMAALCDNPLVSKLLTYRFPGERYAKDGDLQGHKLGSLILVALNQLNGNFEQSIETLQKLFNIKGSFYPASVSPVTISAKTIEGKIIKGEESIDLGKYNGTRILDFVYLHPQNAKAPRAALSAIEKADLIIAGPGDLYTTILPVLIVKEIGTALKKSKARKMFVINIANKPFETKQYTVARYVESVKKHLGSFPFESVLVNNNLSVAIPKRFKYSYVRKNGFFKQKPAFSLVEKDLVDETFPLYHNSAKLAKAVFEAL